MTHKILITVDCEVETGDEPIPELEEMVADGLYGMFRDDKFNWITAQCIVCDIVEDEYML